MKVFGVFLCIVLAAIQSKAQTSPLQVIRECEGSNHVTLANLIQTYAAKQPVSENMKCFEACVAKKAGIYSPTDGKIHIDGITDQAKKILILLGSDNIDGAIKTVQNSSGTCDASVNKQGSECEVVYQFIQCLVAELRKAKLLPNM